MMWLSRCQSSTFTIVTLPDFMGVSSSVTRGTVTHAEHGNNLCEVKLIYSSSIKKENERICCRLIEANAVQEVNFWSNDHAVLTSRRTLLDQLV